MSNLPPNNEIEVEPGRERLVYVMSEQASGIRTNDNEIDLVALWNLLWREKWLMIGVTIFFAVGSLGYALYQTDWYRAGVLLAPAEERATPSIGGQLGGLAALAGVSVGGGESAEAIATLKSRDFARAFIEEYNLLPVFFSDDWDADLGRWRISDSADPPDIRDAIKFFHQNVLIVTEESDTGFVTLTVEWTDPSLAALWAMELAKRLNQRLRERALLEAEANVAYLQTELAQTNVVTLQQSVGRLLEAELQKLMLARGSEEFAFRVIDSAAVPQEPSKPRRALIAMVGTILGAILGLLAVLFLHVARDHESTQS